MPMVGTTNSAEVLEMRAILAEPLRAAGISNYLGRTPEAAYACFHRSQRQRPRHPWSEGAVQTSPSREELFSRFGS